MQDKDVKLDKELYRQAREWYREWNIAEEKERYRTAHEHSSDKSVQEFLSLWQFFRRMKLQQNLRQQAEKEAAIVRYYERVQKLEAWRIANGRKF